jgi:hypothetical protein
MKIEFEKMGKATMGYAAAYHTVYGQVVIVAPTRAKLEVQAVNMMGSCNLRKVQKIAMRKAKKGKP